MTDPILAVNTGSSSVKVAVFEGDRAVVRASASGLGSSARARVVVTRGRDVRETEADLSDHHAALGHLLDIVALTPAAIGHRVVHGGPRFVEPVRIDDRVVADLEALTPLAPLHQPSCLDGIRAARERHPAIPHVACFDTAFHAGLPEIARRLPIDERWARAGVRKYGFHGLSYEGIVATLAPIPPRVVVAHLGSGASLCAIAGGRSVDTTMGLTPAGGIVMGTRTGDLDPGVLVYLTREGELDADALERLVNHDAGLRAVGGTSDVRTLVEREAAGDAAASSALAMFGLSIRRAIGGLVAVLGGIDLLVFTGGVGEHAPSVRAEACRGLDAMGIRLDADANAAAEGAAVVSPPESPVVVRVEPAVEELVIARHARALGRGAAPT